MKKVIKLTGHDVAVYREIRTGVQTKPNFLHAIGAFILNIFISIPEKEYVSDADLPQYK